MVKVDVASGDITTADTDAIVVNLFEGVTSPGGGTGAVDRALDGGISAVIADRDARVVAITAAVPDGTGLDRFERAHPGRVYDAGIAEQHAVTFAAGMATEGMRPVCAIYSTFLQRGFDQVVHDVAIQELPVVFAVDRAGLVGADGPTHQGMFDMTFLRLIPNLSIFSPSNEAELAGHEYLSCRGFPTRFGCWHQSS